MLKSKVSIIIVTYNAGSTIEKAICSVLGQTYRLSECVVIDGLSDDNTVDILEQYSDKITYVSEKDEGIYDAMNKGLEYATGEWILYLGADDMLELSAIEDLVQESYGFDIVYGNTTFVHHKYDKKKKAAAFFKLNRNMICSHQSLMMRKELIQSLGGFNLDYKITADYDLILRAFFSGCRFRYVDKYISRFAIGGVSSNNYTCDKEWYKLAQAYKLHTCPFLIYMYKVGRRFLQNVKQEIMKL